MQSAEQKSLINKSKDIYRLKFHLMPAAGWMNDPNGLCQFKGLYHVFYQYSPLDANGGMKAWGHYTSLDLIHWNVQTPPLFPDTPYDRDGVYSGSALIHKEKMYLFYTGNVKHLGKFDYIEKGREANTILVESVDGCHFSDKTLLMTNKDYPEDYTCHVRDPKVWKAKDGFYMIQGGRKKGNNQDKGAVIIFHSKDLYHWNYRGEITTTYDFGYMWECPDYFSVQETQILSISPQGLQKEDFCHQNVYQSGYFILEKPEEAVDETGGTLLPGSMIHADFHEWDMGFDFYAPQSFEDEKGRRIVIGWAGITDADYDNLPTIEKGWQHALTMPRCITVKNGKLYQNPVNEISALLGTQEFFECGIFYKAKKDIFKLEMQCNIENNIKLVLTHAKESAEMVTLCWEQGTFSLTLTEKTGRGRDIRRWKIKELYKIEIYADTSLLEIYLNDGEMAATTRMYFDSQDRYVYLEGTIKNSIWDMKGMIIQ